jgi:AcrR family transcriptional regulator
MKKAAMATSEIPTLAKQANADVDDSVAGGKSTKLDWLNLAIEALINEGIDQVKVQVMAKKLGVSRSSFYWFFDSIQDLQDQLLSHWLTRNTGPIIERAMRPAATITKAICNVFECWVDPKLFDPNLDIAVRFWGRRDAKVRSIVEQADDQRVEALSKMFKRYDYGDEDAFIRARILYFTQIGHYTLEVQDTLAMRLVHLRSYLRGFAGVEPEAEEIEAFEKFVARYSKGR